MKSQLLKKLSKTFWRNFYAGLAMHAKMGADMPRKTPEGMKGKTVGQYVANQSFIVADLMIEEMEKDKCAK